MTSNKQKDFILTGLMNIWLDCITIIIALSIMFFLDVKLTFCYFYFSILYFNCLFFFGRLRKLTRVLTSSAEVQGLHERVQGMSVIKSFAIEDNEEKF